MTGKKKSPKNTLMDAFISAGVTIAGMYAYEKLYNQNKRRIEDTLLPVVKGSSFLPSAHNASFGVDVVDDPPEPVVDEPETQPLRPKRRVRL